MNKENKQQQVAQMHDKLKQAKAVFLADFRGMTVEKATTLRNELRAASVDYKVFKNTLFDLAAQDTDMTCLAPYLAGLRVPDDAQCVQVRFFARYPLRSVLRLPDREPVRDGPLRGDFLAVFERGTELPFRAQGELSLQQQQLGLLLQLTRQRQPRC